jgi:type I restriction enzyme S subunit
VTTDDMAGWNVSREVAVVPVDQALASSAYISLWIASDECQRWLTGMTKGVAYTGINIEDLRTLPLKLPLKEEQVEIVRRVETLFAFAEGLEARLQTARRATERLTPALLAKAFRGELVPQDPNDEPASELLRRLQQEAPLTSTKRGRKSGA